MKNALLMLGLLTASLPAQPPDAQLAPETLNAYRQEALTHSGDPKAGRRLFEQDQRLACSACHLVTGMEKSGPNLDGVGDKYTREELIREVLEPSATIKPGFEQTVIVTRNGQTLSGRLERATRLAVRLIDTEGRQINLDRTEIEQLQQLERSLMPDNVAASISAREFADLIAYLESLRFEVRQGLAAGGQSVPIPRLERPVRFVPLSATDSRFENPVWCGVIPGTGGQLAIVEHQQARIWRFAADRDPPVKELFLDISDEAYISGNQGLMCIAFHPQFVANGRYFLEFEVEQQGRVYTTVAERQVTENRLLDSGTPTRRLLAVEQPAYNHNGGCIAFGPDGMLYAGFGDGGPQRDPPGHAQNLRVLLGSMVRIDVETASDQLPYGIPPDNPFWDKHQADPEIRPEIWAYGFREPWRFSFDTRTGDLLLGDVGQDLFEEVSLVHRGENHGWNVREAFAPYSEEYRREGERYTDPLFAYQHGLGFSVTGGYVYRADPDSSFYGVYIFGDYNTRRVWGLRYRDEQLLEVREIGTAPGGIVSFGLDAQGELLLVTYDGGLFRLDVSVTEFR